MLLRPLVLTAACALALPAMAQAQTSATPTATDFDEVIVTATRTAITTDAFGPLCRELRRAEALGHDVDMVLPTVAAQGTLLTADDVCAVMAHRLARTTGRPGAGAVRVLPGGIPEALGEMPSDEREALDMRARLLATNSTPSKHELGLRSVPEHWHVSTDKHRLRVPVTVSR